MIFKIYPAENLWWLYVVFVVAAIVMVFGYLSMLQQSKHPDNKNKFSLKLRFILPVTAVGMLVACWVVYKQETAILEITEEALIVHAGWYSQEIARSGLKLEEARLVNLKEDRPLQPVNRTNGTGAPTLQAGWFILRNQQKAFLLVTDARKVLYLPARDFVLLASLKTPEKFLKNLSK